MERSKKYWLIKEYYDIGVWSAERVHNAVTKGWITEEECIDILGEEVHSKFDMHAEEKKVCD